MSTLPSAFRPLNASSSSQRTRALDIGAGIGRVTADVLLHLVTDVVLVEPVEDFVKEALARARASAEDPSTSSKISWPGLAEQTKSVTILQDTLQNFHPLAPHRAEFHDRIGYQPLRPIDDIGMGFDVIWCQWCLGYMTNPDLITFLKRSHDSLNAHSRSLIVIKENICSDAADGSAQEIFETEDSSLTRCVHLYMELMPSTLKLIPPRSDKTWKQLFKLAGLRLVKERVQEGLPTGLYVVKMCVIVVIRNLAIKSSNSCKGMLYDSTKKKYN